MNIYIILLVSILVSSIEAFKILVLYPMPSYSHQRPIMALTESLVQKGHEVYVVSPNPVPGLNNSNYIYVNVSFSYNFFANTNFMQGTSKWDAPSESEYVSAIPNHQFLSEPFLQFQKQVKAEKIKFDVAIIEMFFGAHTCAMTRFLSGDTPIISMSSLPYDWYAETSIGSIQHFSYMPFVWNSFTNRMSMFQKMENWFTALYLQRKINNAMADNAKTFFQETYGPQSETLAEDCASSISLSLITSNSLYYYPRLLPPNVVEVGPVHIKPPKNLPQNLQDWLDGAEKGVIYFSLGGNLKSKFLPEDARSNFLKFFRELPPGYRVLWKWELEGKIPGQSDNILGQKWLPQESVLAHPKVKVFITQGGLQSFHEAVHYGVPLVGIPWFADQGCNVAKMVDAGIGAYLGPEELHSYEKIKSALEAVLYDEWYKDAVDISPSFAPYSKKMKKLSTISHVFTSQALDKATFWVEFVAEHGAPHLRPSTADTTYFQFFCLDIISVILALSFIVLLMIYLTWKLLVHLYLRNKARN